MFVSLSLTGDSHDAHAEEDRDPHHRQHLFVAAWSILHLTLNQAPVRYDLSVCRIGHADGAIP